jgi:hypothetical protein
VLVLIAVVIAVIITAGEDRTWNWAILVQISAYFATVTQYGFFTRLKSVDPRRTFQRSR